MSRSRLLLPLAALFLLAACAGFEPLYAEQTSRTAAMKNLSLAPIEGRAGFLFSQAMLERGGVHEGESGAWVLQTSLKKTHTAVGVRVDQVSTRSRMTVTAKYTVRDKTGAIVYRGRQTSMAAYDEPDQPYGALAAEQDAEERATRVLAEKVFNDLAVFFKTRDRDS